MGQSRLEVFPNSNTTHSVQVSVVSVTFCFFLSFSADEQYTNIRDWITATCQRILSWINRAGALQRSLSPIPVRHGLSVWPVLSPTSLSAVWSSVTESYFQLFWRSFSKEKPQPVMYKILQILSATKCNIIHIVTQLCSIGNPRIFEWVTLSERVSEWVSECCSLIGYATHYLFCDSSE